MFKLTRFMKPFIGLLLIAMVLLYGQAMADLALPDYMSNIVNIGIQQSGIKSAVPDALRQSEMNKLTLFMTDAQKTEVLDDYTLIDSDSTDYSKNVDKYPQLEKEPIYVLKNIDKSELDAINLVVAKAELAVTGIDKMKETAKDGVISFNGQNIPATTDLYAVLAAMPAQQRTAVNEKINEKFSSLGDTMIISAATSSVKTEYDALGVDTAAMQRNYILLEGGYMLIFALLSAAATIAVGYLAAKTAAGFSKNLRKSLFAKVESFSNTEFDKFSTASLITRTTNDITQIQTLIVMGVRMLIYAPILGVGGVIKAMDKAPSMSWIIALAVVLLLGLIGSVLVIALPKFKAIQKLIDRLNLVTRESLSGMMVIRAFNNESIEEVKFDAANTELTKTNLFVNRVMVTLFPIMMLIMNGTTLLVVWVGAHKIADSVMQVGDMMAFMQYAMQILFAFLMMSFMFIIVPRASVSAQRIAEVLAVEPTIIDSENPAKFGENAKGSIEFKNVSFKYPGAEENIIKNVSFTAKPGQTTAIIGSTGAGKTTLINLIPRFYDITEGQILVDGIDVKDVTQFDLRDKIGYIPQKGNLFKGTIETNLKYADKNATEAALIEAAETAQAMEFINEKTEKFATEISQGGTNVSGGQKQRLSIARALVKKPEIYIFDDSFSALDFKTDAALRRALKNKTGDSTVLIVAQRISTIKTAEQIIVLEEGSIVGIGTHAELMETCQTYQEIALSQLSKEELA